MINPAMKIECACPLNGKICTDGSREDFPMNAAGSKVKCRWWQHIYGKDPQTEKMIDEFDCSIPWLTITTVETSQRANQTSSEVSKVANIMHQTGNRMVRGLLALAKRQGISIASPPEKPQLNGKQDG